MDVAQNHPTRAAVSALYQKQRYDPVGAPAVIERDKGAEYRTSGCIDHSPDMATGHRVVSVQV
jgi:hypothetical protein